MPRSEPDRREYPGESRTNRLYRLQESFIVHRLRFNPGGKVFKDDLRKAWLEYIGEPDEDHDWKPSIIGHLYESVERMGAEPVYKGAGRDWGDVETFKGVSIISQGDRE